MTLQEFDRIALSVPYRRKGMFYSEVFCFLEACQRHRVSLVIESGIKFGMSTKLLSSAFPVTGEIIAIDRDSAAFDANYPGVRMMQGDSRVLIPRLLQQEAAKSARRCVGVLIDGPKGDIALALKDQCLSAEICRVVAVHDASTGSGETSHTWEPQFGTVRALLDRHVPINWQRKYPMGPGLGIWEKKL